MNTAEAPGNTGGLGRVWLLIPALWLLVGIGGFSALSYWPQWFAEPLRADRSPDSAEYPVPTSAAPPGEPCTAGKSFSASDATCFHAAVVQSK
jgi:hypothetical protein